MSAIWTISLMLMLLESSKVSNSMTLYKILFLNGVIGVIHSSSSIPIFYEKVWSYRFWCIWNLLTIPFWETYPLGVLIIVKVPPVQMTRTLGINLFRMFEWCSMISFFTLNALKLATLLLIISSSNWFELKSSTSSSISPLSESSSMLDIPLYALVSLMSFLELRMLYT